jgi:Putative peptidoglycan binding domain
LSISFSNAFLGGAELDGGDEFTADSGSRVCQFETWFTINDSPDGVYVVEIENWPETVMFTSDAVWDGVLHADIAVNDLDGNGVADIVDGYANPLNGNDVAVDAGPVDAGAVDPSSCDTYSYNDQYPIRRCDEGYAVSIIQGALVSHGYTVDVDGYFGPGTEQAVRDFQRNAGLEVDGLVGPHTWSTLGVSVPGSDLDDNGIIDPDEVAYD